MHPSSLLPCFSCAVGPEDLSPRGCAVLRICVYPGAWLRELWRLAACNPTALPARPQKVAISACHDVMVIALTYTCTHRPPKIVIACVSLHLLSYLYGAPLNHGRFDSWWILDARMGAVKTVHHAVLCTDPAVLPVSHCNIRDAYKLAPLVVSFAHLST